MRCSLHFPNGPHRRMYFMIIVYSHLFSLQSNNPLIMGEPNTNSPRLLYILTKVLGGGGC